MDGLWSQKWKATLIWASAYLNFMAFALVGGYVIVKEEDAYLRKTAKSALVITLIFTAINAFLSVFSGFGNFFDNYYASAAYDFYSILSFLFTIAKIGVFAFLVIRELLRDRAETASSKEENGL